MIKSITGTERLKLRLLVRRMLSARRTEFLELNLRAVAFLLAPLSEVILVLADGARKRHHVSTCGHDNILRLSDSLLQDLGDDAGSDGVTAFSDGEAHAFLESDGRQ